jgi:hypothetical protein
MRRTCVLVPWVGAVVAGAMCFSTPSSCGDWLLRNARQSDEPSSGAAKPGQKVASKLECRPGERRGTVLRVN